jgi:hypothetical protein
MISFEAHRCGRHEPRFARRYAKHTVFGFGHVLPQWPQAHARLIMANQGPALLLSNFYPGVGEIQHALRYSFRLTSAAKAGKAGRETEPGSVTRMGTLRRPIMLEPGCYCSTGSTGLASPQHHSRTDQASLTLSKLGPYPAKLY